MATILPPLQSQYIDQNGLPIVGGFLYFYEVGTLTAKDTFQNPEATIQNSQPLVLGATGNALAYGTGDYRVILKDADSILIYDGVISAPLPDSNISLVMQPVTSALTLSQARDRMGVTAQIATAIAGVSTIAGPTGPAGPAGGTGSIGPTGPTGAAGSVISGTNAQGSWLQFPSGLIQWGNGTTDSSENFTGNFPTPFPTACTSLVATVTNGTGGGQSQLQVTINNSSTFYVRTFSRLGPGFGTFFWQAMGY